MEGKTVKDKQQVGIEQGIVFVGDKGLTAYVVPAMKHLTDKGFVEIKARGKSISKAIGLAFRIQEMAESKRTVDIESTEIVNDDGKKYRVSGICIRLEKI